MLDTAIQFTALFGFVYLAACFVSHSIKWSDRYAPQAATAPVQETEAPVQEEPLVDEPQDNIDLDISADDINRWESQFDFIPSGEEINAQLDRHVPAAAASISAPSATLTVEDIPMVERAAGDMTKAELKTELRRLGCKLPRGRANHAKLVGLVEAAWAAESNA